MKTLRPLAALALAALCALQLLALMRAPAAWMPATITLHLARGASLPLDSAMLGAPAGSGPQLRLRRDDAGSWWIARTGGDGALAIERDASWRRSGSIAVAAGQRFQVGPALFTIDALDDAGAADFSRAGGSAATIPRWRYDGATLLRDGAAQPACPEARIGTRAVALWNRIAPASLRFPRPLVFGGNLDCGNRLAIAGLGAPAATLTRGRDGLVLASGGADAQAPLLLGDTSATSASAAPDQLLKAPTARDQFLRVPDARVAPLTASAALEPPLKALAAREQRLDGADALLVGRTRLLLAPETGGDSLALLPASHVALYTVAQLHLPPGLAWTWTARDLWRLPGAAAVALSVGCGAGLVFALALLRPWRRRPASARPTAARAARSTVTSTVNGAAQATTPASRHSASGQATQALAGATLAGGALALLWLQRGGAAPGAGVFLLAAWASLGLTLWAPRRLPLALAAGVLLLAVGVLAQLDLGLGAPESSWLRHFQKTASLLALGVGAAAALRPWHPAVPLAQARIEALLVLVAGIALVALLLQVAFGDETGVFDLQPVEFAKLALAALSAHCLALAAGGQPAPGGALRRVLRLATPALLFMVLLGVALVQVDDYSPLVLLGVWGAAMAMAQALATRQHGASAALVAGACLVVAGIAALRGGGPAALADLAQWNFYADRFLVWLDPGTHPHTGQQLLLGARAIADGGWFGADHLFGLEALGRDAGGAVHIPAVQDDFAPSFFLNRHGLAVTLGLWLLQAAFVAGLLALALRCWQAQAGARDFRRAWLARFRCFLLCGGAAFVFGHFLLSWGTNLAIFPVMGQPMSFLSAGGSHLLFFICPLLAFAAASAQSLEEP